MTKLEDFNSRRLKTTLCKTDQVQSLGQKVVDSGALYYLGMKNSRMSREQFWQIRRRNTSQPQVRISSTDIVLEEDADKENNFLSPSNLSSAEREAKFVRDSKCQKSQINHSRSASILSSPLAQAEPNELCRLQKQMFRLEQGYRKQSLMKPLNLSKETKQTEPMFYELTESLRQASIINQKNNKAASLAVDHGD